MTSPESLRHNTPPYSGSVVPTLTGKYKPIGLILLLLAYGLLYPGLTRPMLTVTGVVEKTDMVELGQQLLKENQNRIGLVGDMANLVMRNMKVEGTVEAFNKTRSIIGTVQDLLRNGNILVGVLIVTFSVIIPVIKGFITMISLLNISRDTQCRLGRISAAISKWSMADVFVIAIFMSYLAANGLREDTGLVQFSSQPGSGFYFFLGYCVVSILASQILNSETGTSRQK